MLEFLDIKYHSKAFSIRDGIILLPQCWLRITKGKGAIVSPILCPHFNLTQKHMRNLELILGCVSLKHRWDLSGIKLIIVGWKLWVQF